MSGWGRSRTGKMEGEEKESEWQEGEEKINWKQKE